MCERRVLFAAVVTDIHDSAVAYPSCIGCYSKLLVDPTTGRYHCIRCGTNCNKSKVQWRYRLVLSIADGTTIGRVVVFGKTLDGFFGKTATCFYRSLDDLEQTGYPASSMLLEALLRTFHGKFFYFGFKWTGSNDTGETLALKHVLKLGDTSECYSQLDCTSNFENSHTLAYQMLACSDAMYATVTDHMRFLVKHLRKQQNQSNEIKSPCSEQSCKPLKETDLGKSFRDSLSKTWGSLCKTVSFGEDQESVRFSFEASTNQRNSAEETYQLSVKRSPVLLNSPFIEKQPSETLQTYFANHETDSQIKENFLAASELNTKDWPSYVTFDTFTEDVESCFPSVETCSKLIGTPPGKHTSMTQNSRSDYSVAPLFTDSVGNHINTFSHASVTHRLDFEHPDESEMSNTSRRIDDELQRREIVSFHKNISHKQMNWSIPIAVTNKELCLHANVKETKQSPVMRVSKDLKDISNDFYPFDPVTNDRSLKNCKKERDTLLYTDLQRNQNCDIIAEIRMPDSEDLDAFFESQFDGIEFTQEVMNVGHSTVEDSKDECMSEQHGNVGIQNNKEKCTDIVQIADLGPKEVNDVKNSLESGSFIISSAEERNVEAKSDKINNDYLYLPELENLKDFLNSFEDCSNEQEQPVENNQEIIIRANATEDVKLSVDNINMCTSDKCPDMDEEPIAVKCFGKGESPRGAGFHEERELFLTLSFVEDNHEEAGCGLDEEDENEKNKCVIVEDKTDSGESLSYHSVKTLPTASRVTSFDRICKEELEFEHKENASGNLEDFLSDISYFEHFQENEVKNTRLVNLQMHYETDIDQERDVVKEKISVATNAEKSAENEESDLKHFFHELSQVSLDKAQMHSVLEDSAAKYDNVLLSCQNEREAVRIDQTENEIHTLTDSSQNAENDSVIDKTPDFEETKLKMSLKSAFTLVPFCSEIKLGKKVQTVIKPKCLVGSEASKFDGVKSGTLNENDKKEGTSKCFTVNTEVNDFSAGQLNISEETPVTENECKSLKYGSSFVNYSADLFEMSEAEIEKNSEYILSVCTPSFNLKPGSENSILNEVLLEDGPLGTSTPGLDECVLVDSLNTSGTVNEGFQNRLMTCDDGSKKVKFHNRLRRVSSCRVMDIRMKLNESPLTAIPQVMLKSCLKSSKEPYMNDIVEWSKVSKRTNIEQKPMADVSKNLMLENKSICILADRSSTGFTNQVEQKIVCLDGSSDLFGDSFIVSANENCSSAANRNGNIGQKIDIVRAQVEKDVKEVVKLKSDVCDINKDLWLNESSDSLCEAVPDENQNEHGVAFDDFIGSRRKPEPVFNVTAEIKLINEKPETPDLFISQENFDFFHLDRKSSVISHSGSSELPENQSNKQIPHQGKRKIWKDSSRQALKCLVINTPDCDNDIFSINRPSLLKLKNQPSEAANDHEKENISVNDSPDIFGDSVEELDRKIVCDKNSVVKKSNFLCKKLLF